MFDQATINDLKAKLTAKQSELEGELNALTKKELHSGGRQTAYPVFSSTQEGSVDEDAEIDEAEKYDADLALTASLKKDHAAVNAALERMADGTYGRCLNCGRDIAPERLNAFPEAEKCRECAT
ncbi:MAG: TraR/DksA C4-type zinc finger protein [bacterium]|nr:TraR/DksA C4-type zinc finger protein [bacterium]MDZ4295904.1 TraR/DksA C4-type zinc finger protein [Patescibacteria group bacterium]